MSSNNTNTGSTTNANASGLADHAINHYPHYGPGGHGWPTSHSHAQAPGPYIGGYPGGYPGSTYPPLYGPNDAPHGPYPHPTPTGFSGNPKPAIDPALDDDDEFPGPTQPILPKKAKPVEKVAGSRRPPPALSSKAKGKQKAAPKRNGAELDDEPNAKRTKRCGRVAGAANYNDEDLDVLLDYIEDYLPIGGLSWNTVGASFNEWALSVGHPERSVKSLEAKFKQLVRTTKPTGDAECPPHVERAHFIEDMISSKVETRELDDSEIVDAPEDEISDHGDANDDNDDDDDDDDGKPRPKTTVQPIASKANIKKEPDSAAGPVARRLPADRIIPPRNRNSRNNASELLGSITRALDPATQAARDDERATRSLHTTQLLTVSQTLRDAQLTIENLRTQLQQAQNDRHEAERRADRAEMRALMEHGSPFSDRFSRYRRNSPSTARLRRQRRLYDTPHRPSSSRHIYETPRQPSSSRYSSRLNEESPGSYTRNRGFQQTIADASPLQAASPSHDRRVRRETFFHNGGRHVEWVGGSDDGNELNRLPHISPGTISYTVNPYPSPDKMGNESKQDD